MRGRVGRSFSQLRAPQPLTAQRLGLGAILRRQREEKKRERIFTSKAENPHGRGFSSSPRDPIEGDVCLDA